MLNKKLFSNRLTVAVLAFLLGGVSVWGAGQLISSKHQLLPKESSGDSRREFFNDVFNQQFFARPADPYAEMRRLTDRLFKDVDDPSGWEESFNQWYGKKFGGDVGEMRQREDEAFIYYEIDFQDQAYQDIKVILEHGQLSISGQLVTQNEAQGTKSYWASSFSRSIPIPFGVEAEKFTTEQDGNKLIIKLPKRLS